MTLNAPRTPALSLSADRVFVMVCSLAICTGLSVIGALVLAAVAFSQAITVCIPLVATFRGFVDEGGSHALTVDAAWGWRFRRAVERLISSLTSRRSLVRRDGDQAAAARSSSAEDAPSTNSLIVLARST